MRVVQVHNFYQQPGGEDQVFRAECRLLRERGHEVETYIVHNDQMRGKAAIKAAVETTWNQRTYRNFRALLQKLRPDVIHCHNIFPVLSPALYYAAEAERMPVVQTLHNYRLICPKATLYRRGRICEECVGHMVPYPAVLHACYRSSRTASLAVTSMLTAHRLLQTWTRKVDTFIALTEFARSKLVAGGLPAGKITVKPNFLPDDVEPGRGEGDFAVYVGRLSKEKGLHTLLRAWKNIPDYPLRILGDGPLRTELHEAVRELPNVSLAGHCSAEQVRETMRSAKFLVMPSEWYEGFPMTAVEAMAAGTPMIASDLGSLQEVIVEDTGLRFRPGDAADLTRQVRKLLANPEELTLLRQRTRRHYELNFTAERNYRQLIAIYEGAAAIQTKVRI